MTKPRLGKYIKGCSEYERLSKCTGECDVGFERNYPIHDDRQAKETSDVNFFYSDQSGLSSKVSGVSNEHTLDFILPLEVFLFCLAFYPFLQRQFRRNGMDFVCLSTAFIYPFL